MNRDDLKKYKATQDWIKGRLEMIEELRMSINKLTSNLSDEYRGADIIQDREAEKLAKLLDYVNDTLTIINEENEKQKRILTILDKLDQPYRNILDKHYIQGKSLTVVAVEMNYSYDRMKKLNSTALYMFEKKSTQKNTEKPYKK